jgi:predicted polyphosphate/ATP-dependent NAD kinase
MIETLIRHEVSMLFVVGGDGSLRGAQKLAAEALARDLPIALATAGRNQVDPHGELWMSVLEFTGQPKQFC